MEHRPLLAVTMGDAAGIGPEISLKALSSPVVCSMARCCLFGDAHVLESAARFPGMPDLRLNFISDPRNGDYSEGVVNVVSLDRLHSGDYVLGKVNALCGQSAFESIAQAVASCRDGVCDALVTTCINKESLRAAKVPYIGHTEILGGVLGEAHPITVFSLEDLLVFFLSRHLSLMEAISKVRKDNIVGSVRRCFKVLEQLGRQQSSFAVAGLNPHCGEHGLFGREEVDEIMPAVSELQKLGLPVVGPVSADAVFHQGIQGRYGGILSLYHDQGHIATKTRDFVRTISITGGLSILRTSVDHGTAFDIAGKGLADEASLVEAITVAARYAPTFRPWNEVRGDLD